MKKTDKKETAKVKLMKELTQYVREEDAKLMSTWLLENFKLKEGKVI
jgi:hypothetical protein